MRECSILPPLGRETLGTLYKKACDDHRDGESPLQDVTGEDDSIKAGSLDHLEDRMNPAVAQGPGDTKVLFSGEELVALEGAADDLDDIGRET
ncbi:MAG: hypothetical protein AB1700_05545 [Bacillota bacterium]